MKKMFVTFLLMLLPGLAAAQSYDDVVEAQILPGWRLPNGDHMAALHLKLAPGWKTYWRSPGDAGIPPQFDWSGARNMSAIGIYWPAPHVFWQQDMRSVGYKGDVILPLRIRPSQLGKDARLGGIIDIGICKDVCPTASAFRPACPPGRRNPMPGSRRRWPTCPSGQKMRA